LKYNIAKNYSDIDIEVQYRQTTWYKDLAGNHHHTTHAHTNTNINNIVPTSLSYPSPPSSSIHININDRMIPSHCNITGGRPVTHPLLDFAVGGEVMTELLIDREY
jgi:hypothetical protein